MLINSSRLTNCPILSLHVGGKIAQVVEPIVDPNDLKIIAFKVDGPLVGREAGNILPIQSIREFSRLGMIIDSTDELVEEDGIVNIKKILDLNFSLIGLKVQTKKGDKLGKVIDFSIEPESWQVQQITVQRPWLKSFLDPELIISRQQVADINDYVLTIKDEHEKPKSKAKAKTNADIVSNFINPFREPDFASETEAKKLDK